MNRSKHQNNEVQYPMDEHMICLCMAWSRPRGKLHMYVQYIGLTEVIQLSPHKLLFTIFLSLMIFLTCPFSWKLSAFFNYVPLLFSLLPLIFPWLTAPIMTRKTSCIYFFNKGFNYRMSALFPPVQTVFKYKWSCILKTKWVYVRIIIQARQYQVANNYCCM